MQHLTEGAKLEMHFLPGHKHQLAPLLPQEAAAYGSRELSHEELLQLCGGACAQHLRRCAARQLRHSEEKDFTAGGEECTKDSVVQPEGSEQAEERLLARS